MILSVGYQAKNGTKSLRVKTWMIMKLTIGLLLFFTFQVNAKPLAQRITIVKDNIHLSEVFKDIEQQTGVHFFYDKDMIQKTAPIDVALKNVTLEQALSACLKGQQLTYSMVKNTVVISSEMKTIHFQAQPIKATEPPPIEIHGKVRDENGSPLANASVTIKGTNQGVTTNNNGDFTISAPNTQAVLTISFTGYVSQEIKVGNRTSIDIDLVKADKALSEVVVTALGIKKESRELGYAATSVNIADMNENKTTNFASGLQGKVAGLNVMTPPSGPGGSVKIRLRGQTSFQGDNSPLIVVDGTPFNNGLDGASNGAGPSGAPTVDEGDGLQSIDPDDIASITVLKGAAAAALYGHRAKDGAIIITTKSGKNAKGIGVEISSNFQLSQPLDFTNFQYEYGQGENGIRPQNMADAISSGVWSFGEKFDGKPTPQLDGEMHPYSPHKNRIKDFYRTADDWTQSVALSGGNDKGSFRLSFANTDASAIVPNSSYHKKLFNLGLNYHFTPKLSLQLNANYSNLYNKNPAVIGMQNLNVNTSVYTLANSIDIKWLRNKYEDPVTGNEQPFSRWTYRTNPYWSVNKDFYNVRKDRLFANVLLKYQLTDWLYIQGRIGQDYFTHPVDLNAATGSLYLSPAATGYNGYYYQSITTFRERNMDFLIGINKKFGDFGLDVALGGNQMQQINQEEGSNATNFYVRDLYTIQNGIIKTPVYNFSEKRINSLYGSAEFSYKTLLYLTFTGRNDWYSTLNPKSNNFLYPSVSGSFVFSDLFASPLPWLNFGKLRASYAQVGGDTDPYSDRVYYTMNANQFNGVALGSISATISPDANLRPLKVSEADIGLQMRMFNSRLNLDLSVYKKLSVDEIVNVDVSNASGYSSTTVNNGSLRNQGIETLLSYDFFNNRSFGWTSSFNGSYNISKVLSLAEGQKSLDVGTGEYFGIVSSEVGKPLGSLRGFDYKRDDQGRILLSGGKPIQGNIVTFGSAVPKWNGGWINSFVIKGFSIFTQVDFKAGFKIISQSNLNFLREGLSKQSLPGREGGVVFDGIDAVTGKTNTISVPAEDFYSAYRSTALATPFVYNGSFVRLRTVSVGYDLSRFIKNSFVKGLKVSALVNNVLMIKKYIDNLDPETQYSTSDNLQGLESHTLPTVRSYGLSIDVKL